VLQARAARKCLRSHDGSQPELGPTPRATSGASAPLMTPTPTGLASAFATRGASTCPSEPPLVSLVITCYNQAAFLAAAIESALAQSHQPCEVIVVDDGSTDETADVTARYTGVRYVGQRNVGLPGARNTGIRESHGQYLIFLDADDLLLPRAVEAGLVCHREHPQSAFVYGHFRYIDRDGEVINQYPPEPLPANPYAAFLRGNFIGMHATVLYARATFSLVGMYQASLKACEDYDLYLRITRRFQIARHDELVAEYRWHGTNMSFDSPRMLASAICVLRSQHRHVRATPDLLRSCIWGIHFWRGHFQRALFARVRRDVSAGRWYGMFGYLRPLLEFMPYWVFAYFTIVVIKIELAVQLRVPRLCREQLQTALPDGLGRRDTEPTCFPLAHQ
jgi:glycosyltransferase involved in cell wall biosynthesis